MSSTIKKLFIVLLVGLYSCVDSDHYGMGEFDTINTSDQIKFMFNEFSGKTKKSGLSARLSYLSYALESFYIPPNYKTEIGSDSLKKLYGFWDKQNKIVDYELQDVHVYPVNKVAANYHYKVKLVYVDSSNTKKQLIQIESGAVIKVENKWLYLNYQVGE